MNGCLRTLFRSPLGERGGGGGAKAIAVVFIGWDGFKVMIEQATRGSSVEVETAQRLVARPLRKDREGHPQNSPLNKTPQITNPESNHRNLCSSGRGEPTRE